MRVIRAFFAALGLITLAAGGAAAYSSVRELPLAVPNRTTTDPTTHAPAVHLPHRPGYDRDCGRQRGCVFGPAWNDATDAPMSRNGCDTSNDMRRTQLSDVRLKPGTRGCVVLEGTLVDPYDGRTVRYVKGQTPVPIQTDHVIPLRWAWDAGAATWPLAKRQTFANDPRNLVVASRQTNRAKSDLGPTAWAKRIENPTRRCAFLRRAHQVIALYGLASTRSDAAAFASCGLSADKATSTPGVTP